MQPKEIAVFLGVTSNTIRRWCDEFHIYMTPTANPPKGKVRVLNPHDVRILHYIGISRDMGQTVEEIAARLDTMKADDWRDLPEIPPEWEHPGETMAVSVAAARAYDVAQFAVMQKELEHAQNQLVIAQGRVSSLETELNALQADSGAKDSRIHALELELGQARGEVNALKTQVDSFTLAYGLGRDKPLPIAAIILAALLIGALLVIVSMVIARVIL
jgi:DNA-binding transcriptional MerR regulator